MKKILMIAVMVAVCFTVQADSSINFGGGYFDVAEKPMFEGSNDCFGTMFFRAGNDQMFFEGEALYYEYDYGYGIAAGIQTDPTKKFILSSSLGLSTLHDYTETVNLGFDVKIPFDKFHIGFQTKYRHCLDDEYDNLVSAGMFAGVSF